MNSRELLMNKIVQKASEDRGFKEKLKANPKNVIEQATGVSIPDQIKITVLEENSNEYFLVLPPVESLEGELSEAELDSVSGGTGWGDVTNEVTGATPSFTEGGDLC